MDSKPINEEKIKKFQDELWDSIKVKINEYLKSTIELILQQEMLLYKYPQPKVLLILYNLTVVYFSTFVVFLMFLFLIPYPTLAHGQEGAGATAVVAENLVLLLHIVTAVFMAWPLYALITVNERPKVGAPIGDKVDDFMEGIIKKNSFRCYIFQLTAFFSGLYLTWSYDDLGFTALFTNWRLIGKLLGLFILMGILSYVVFYLQPEIDRLFIKLKDIKSKENIVNQINTLRLKRKKLATTCLFILLTILLLAIQIKNPLPLLVNFILLILIGLFSWRVFKKNIPYGWV